MAMESLRKLKTPPICKMGLKAISATASAIFARYFAVYLMVLLFQPRQ